MMVDIEIFIKIVYNYCEKYIMHEVCIMIFHFLKELYPKTALLKAAYSFTDRAYIHLERVHIKRASKIIANMITERKIESSLS